MIRLRYWLIGFVTLFLLAAFVFWEFDINRTHRLTMATSYAEGYYYPMAEKIKKVLEENGNYEINLINSGGSRNNIDLIHKQKADIAMVQGDTIPIHGERPLVPLFTEILHIVVTNESNLHTFDDVMKHRVCIGNRGSGMQMTNMRLLSHFRSDHHEYEPLCELSYTQTINALENGTEQAAIFFTGIHSPGLKRLLESGIVKYISMETPYQAGGLIDSLRLKFPFYKPYVLPKHFYYGLYPENIVHTIATPALMFSREDLPESIAHDISSILYRHRVNISTASGTSLVLREPFNQYDLPVPLHPGAQAFFDRDKPSYLERYAELASLFVTLIFGYISIYWGQVRYNAGKKRRKLDVFIHKAKDIYKLYHENSENQDFDLKQWRDQVYDLKESCLEALVSNKIREDERYIILQGEVNNLILLAEGKNNFNQLRSRSE